MNLKIFGVLRNVKCALDKRVHILLFDNVNTQARCNSSKLTRPKAIETNRYKKTEDEIGLYGYCLLASNDKIIIY